MDMNHILNRKIFGNTIKSLKPTLYERENGFSVLLFISSNKSDYITISKTKDTVTLTYCIDNNYYSSKSDIIKFNNAFRSFKLKLTNTISNLNGNYLLKLNKKVFSKYRMFI
jgi:hypothetical protein